MYFLNVHTCVLSGRRGSEFCVYIVFPNGSEQQKPLTGAVNMKLSSVVKALGSLCLLLADGFPVSEDGSPEIIGADQVQKKAHLGETLVLHCDAFTKCEDGVTLIYWLVNGSFPEDISSNGGIVESEESTLAEGAILQRSLLLKNVTSEDFNSSFTCVVMSAVGMAQKHVKLVATRGSGVGEKRKH
ncbi:interleukin-1 receptor accessory protein-like [Trachinotus anak]|uniref:interleukin-1 receptor accessory protein-like n=1 Tax=Trachinotus anak TaxID=443729 RepID=UPI0039F1C8D7